MIFSHFKGHEILLHAGSTFGFKSFITLFPDHKIGVFTSMNGEDDNYILRVQLHNFLSDIALGETPWLNDTSICNQIKEPKYTGIAKNQNSIRPIDEYLGLYSNPIYGNLAVEKNHNNENLVLRYGNTTWNLWPRSEKDQFKAEGTGIIKYLKDMNNITFCTTNNKIDSVLAVSFCSTCRSSRPEFFIQGRNAKEAELEQDENKKGSRGLSVFL